MAADTLGRLLHRQVHGMAAVCPALQLDMLARLIPVVALITRH